ncbi:response regulator [Solemya velum gill symbiont]|uniref:Response regulator n=1 Tax=Solemya velum gill symbiont TaxID=2340 RepID=A0A0B0HBU2_SOVGS|nr:response regulator transcription factor [Solemya velum gill symbiont]KHF24876.1 response regulator [Solemya velum gill symbiont]OOY51832.1 hypothetical protein BOV97_07010 [Solemya velum gill symbiont]OOY55944.1 hypothetical protein BOV99_06015 [Solemya velum gill symbiont]OOY57267.1 hypothetical protein BOW00_05815 [Solemya velum gill symbiont]OOY60127.1 hypothetical protein BOW02_06365 [Solemya velum gill symbiont]
MIRVLVVDDHQLVRNGFSQLLSQASDIEVVGQAENGEEGVRVYGELEPDVVLMDIQMPVLDGIEATRKLQRIYDTCNVVILSSVETDPFPLQARDAGAIGFLSKRCTIDELCAAVRNASAGLPYISTEIAQRLALSKIDGGDSLLDTISPREMQVLLLATRGSRNKDIAEEMNISEKTVSTYKQRLYEKLGVKNDVEMAHYALRHHLIEVK